ncbi:dihydrofolate reductase family protein [Mycobacterium kyorinense]|uniref:Deaminase n=1 Tax=Mycobacterium kyorinense TaxID=487514 RepID=A0A1X1Y4A2_9MYCO|nr:dihydrofolate reductase family protein [Mycobacterium kyorinense]ORW05899.1 deaminase [Mycobacterium kyorinense]
MGKLVMSEFVSLDGVIQDPDGQEGFVVGGWVGKVLDHDELSKVKFDEALAAEALLFGRRSYEWFAQRWPRRRGDLADRLNSLPKHVVSSTLHDPEWTNTSVLRGEVAKAVSKLKQEVAGDIVVYASFQLLHTLLAHDLVDEMRLTIVPVVLGAGERLFTRIGDPKPMRLTGIRTVDDQMVLLTYRPARNTLTTARPVRR